MGVLDDVDLVMGTFSKSLASIGGFIASDYTTINFLRHNSRPYIFSASITPSATAAASAALDILKEEPERVQKLWELTEYSLKRFRESGFEIGKTSTPIIPLFVRDSDKTFLLTKMLFEDGVFVNPVVPPATAEQNTLIRYSLMATHTIDQIDECIDKITKAFRQLGIIK